MHTNTQNRSKRTRVWLIISVVAVVVAEAAFTTMVVRSRGLFEYIGLDYRGSRTAGEAILEHGLGAAYQSQLLEESQRRLFDRYVIESEEHSLPFGVVPAPYPPPFTLAFVLSTWLPPVPGYLAWTLFHAFALAVYQLRLARAFGVSKPGWLIVAVILSFPAFINLIMGQISIWLVVFFGEAVIAFDRQQRFRTGVWLGLLVCKPQVLILFVPALVLARQWRVLLGMVALAAVLIVPTLVFAGDWVAGFIEGIVSAAGSSADTWNSRLPITRVSARVPASPSRMPTAIIRAALPSTCDSTSLEWAPSAMRIPISRVLSVTETSMMFMIPIPPTSRDMLAIAARSSVITSVVPCAASARSDWLRTVKSASSQLARPWDSRMIAVISSSVIMPFCDGISG